MSLKEHWKSVIGISMKNKKKIAIICLLVVGFIAILYATGVLAQIMHNYEIWLDTGGISGEQQMQRVNFNPIECFKSVATSYGARAFLGLLIVGGVLFGIKVLYDKFDGKKSDDRGFKLSKSGAYGTAAWMTEKEMKQVLEITDASNAKGLILGEYKSSLVCLPKDSKLNRHVAIFGASGTMKSRAIIRNALFQALKNDESVVITDPKGELYSDTSELYRKNGYDVKVFNLVSPEHGDSWNCMANLNGDTLTSQVLTNVIIGNTSSGSGDRFWDNGEGNLLKALILYIDQDSTVKNEDKNLPAVYKLLTNNSEKRLTEMFDRLPTSHPAKAPYMLFAQASDTVKAGIVLGLGTRLQVLQNKAVQKITSKSEIDLESPAKKKCAYYLITSDQDSTMTFLSSLFFSFLFIKLVGYADLRPNAKCDVPVNLVLDEFNNVGKIGGAEDGSDFARLLSVCRSRDIRVMLAVQSLGQLQNRYANNLWAEIIGNCDTQLMLGCSDDVTAKYFSERSGDMSIEIETTMTRRKTITLAQIIPEYRHNEGQGRRRLLTPDEVLRLPNEEMLCVIRGCNMLKLKKFDYTAHPYYAQIEKTSVFLLHPKIDYGTGEILPEREEDEKKIKKPKLYKSCEPPKDF